MPEDRTTTELDDGGLETLGSGRRWAHRRRVETIVRNSSRQGRRRNGRACALYSRKTFSPQSLSAPLRAVIRPGGRKLGRFRPRSEDHPGRAGGRCRAGRQARRSCVAFAAMKNGQGIRSGARSGAKLGLCASSGILGARASTRSVASFGSSVIGFRPRAGGMVVGGLGRSRAAGYYWRAFRSGRRRRSRAEARGPDDLGSFQPLGRRLAPGRIRFSPPPGGSWHVDCRRSGSALWRTEDRSGERPPGSTSTVGLERKGTRTTSKKDGPEPN